MKEMKKQLFWRSFCRIICALTVFVIVMYLVLDAREENVIAAIYELQLEKYEDSQKEIVEYNRWIVKKYELSSTGNIPVLVEINTEKINSEDIGSDMSFRYEINGKAVCSGDVVPLRLFDTNLFFTEIRENDPSSDDIGESVDEKIYTIGDLNKGIIITQNISVHESYGRSAGKTARYVVTYRIRLNKKIVLSKFDLSEQPEEEIKPKIDEITTTKKQVLQKDVRSKNIAVILLLAMSLVIVSKYVGETIKVKREYRCEQERKRQLEIEKAEFIKTLNGKTIREMANVPKDVKFDEQNFPIDNNNNTRYGSFTVYRSRAGICYHEKKMCCSASCEIHSFEAQRRGLKPCSKCCKGSIVVPLWYREYLDLQQKCKKYAIKERED